jgi:hypothetical protein
MEEKVEKLKKENPELDKLQDKLIQKRQREWMERETRIKNMIGLGRGQQEQQNDDNDENNA